MRTEIGSGARDRRDEPRVVDLCSGSGAIALSVKDEWPEAQVRGLEVSTDAWAWATANRDRLGLDVDLVLGDATRPCFEDWAGGVDLVTVNPPYIPVGAVPVDPEVPMTTARSSGSGSGCSGRGSGMASAA